MGARDYQYRFSDQHQNMYDAAARRQKAAKTIAILRDQVPDLERCSLLDLGCSTGLMTRYYGEHFKSVLGMDIDEPAVRFATANNALPNVGFLLGDAMSTGQPDASFDVVTCSHVYEHVPDAYRLTAELYRVLRPGGICYFAAGNRLTWKEGDYNLPLLSVVPKPLGHLYLRAVGRGSHYYEVNRTLWGLRKLVRRFELLDYTVKVLEDPVRFGATDMVQPGTGKQRLALLVARRAYWLCPTYIWLLRKPS